MPETWARRIRRAEELQTTEAAAASLLTFYIRLLRDQAALHESLNGRPPSGVLEGDLEQIRGLAGSLLQTVAAHGPTLLADEANELLDRGCGAIDAVLVRYWHAPSDRQFFAKAILQPYAQWLAEAGIAPVGRPLSPAPNRCPRCGGTPQLAILEPGGAAAGEGGGRRLLCATCLTPWAFRRVLCPHCGEDNEARLGYFQSPALAHQRVDACDTCRRYLKTIDLGVLGRASPLVDEVAGVTLDVWARTQGYEKIELNLTGL